MTARSVRVLAILVGTACVDAPASAQVVQSLHLGGGVFMLRRQDLRADHDVLVVNRDSLTFEITNLNSGQAFGEWLWAFGGRVELGAGAGVHAGSVHSAYRYYTHPASLGSTDIEQDLRLRVVPITGVVRLFAGTPGEFQPYVGVGASALRFRYSESGEFIDFRDFSTFRKRYVATGTAIGPVLILGLRAPVMGDIWGLTFEWRYQHGVGKTGGLDHGFLDDRIDLGGHNLNFGWLIRF